MRKNKKNVFSMVFSIIVLTFASHDLVRYGIDFGKFTDIASLLVSIISLGIKTRFIIKISNNK